MYNKIESIVKISLTGLKNNRKVIIYRKTCEITSGGSMFIRTLNAYKKINLMIIGRRKMQTLVFPHTYNSQVEERTRRMEQDAQQRSEIRISLIMKTNTIEPPHDTTTVWVWIGVFIGIFLYSYSCSITNGNYALGIFSWIMAIVICFILGKGTYRAEKRTYNSKQSDIASRISEERRLLEKEIKQINEVANAEKQRYYSDFENNVKKTSVQFAESELAKEVIIWMTDGFCRTIDAADRRSHVEHIRVPFVFNVYNNKITCNLGTFDFELKRCRNLNSPLEQTALARAIVSAIQLNIIMKYPKDKSGTDISIDIIYRYTNEYPATTIIYVAPNGNFKAARSW